MKIKNTYLLFITIIGLVSLIMYTTYAIFTESVDVGEFVNLTASSLPTDTSVIEYERLTLSAGETKIIDLNITNSTSNSLYYGVWYEMIEPSSINKSITIAKLDTSVSETIGQLATNTSNVVTLILENNTTDLVVINLGVGYSETSSLNLPTNRNIISDVANSGPKANSPSLASGMVPVTYSEDKWVKADSNNANNSWYNYNDKQWANAVLVTSDYRDSNNNDTFSVGDEVPEDAILAYYVWIPRYKYKVWNIKKEIGVDSYDAYNKGIDIVFEKDTETTGTIDCTTTPYSFAAPTETATNESCVGSNGDYYTHPAFWWDENGNGTREVSEEVRGFWVGKFEVANYNTSSSSYTTGTTTYQVRTKPNVSSWRINNPSSYSAAIQGMQVDSNVYGLTTDKTKADSHMLKNIEWGAVAYLTNSNYGRCSDGVCEDVTINNSSSCITGNAANEVSGESTSGTTNAYNAMKRVLKITEGTGTEITATKTDDATYPWTDNSGLLSSGNKGTKSSTSTLTYTFTLSQAGVLSLDYAVSSEEAFDKLTIKLDSTTLVNAISGTAHGTVEASLNFDNLTTSVEAGEHTLTVSYTKDGSGNTGLDKAYIKNLKVLEAAEMVETIEPAGPLASTTGNVYGVYDMSGGAKEYVMGNMSTAAGSYIYYPNYSSSGTTFTYDATTAKYMDTYAYGTSYKNQITYNRSRLGDATGEVIITTSTTGWYGDNVSLVYSSNPWFVRGGEYHYGTGAGPFYSSFDDGSRYDGTSARAALLVF